MTNDEREQQAKAIALEIRRGIQQDLSGEPSADDKRREKWLRYVAIIDRYYPGIGTAMLSGDPLAEERLAQAMRARIARYSELVAMAIHATKVPLNDPALTLALIRIVMASVFASPRPLPRDALCKMVGDEYDICRVLTEDFNVILEQKGKCPSCAGFGFGDIAEMVKAKEGFRAAKLAVERGCSLCGYKPEAANRG